MREHAEGDAPGDKEDRRRDEEQKGRKSGADAAGDRARQKDEPQAQRYGFRAFVLICAPMPIFCLLPLIFYMVVCVESVSVVVQRLVFLIFVLHFITVIPVMGFPPAAAVPIGKFSVIEDRSVQLLHFQLFPQRGGFALFLFVQRNRCLVQFL